MNKGRENKGEKGKEEFPWMREQDYE